jgi:hypothetical protein
MPLNALTHPMHQFVLVILLVKVKKSYLVWKEKMSRHTGGGRGGGVQRNVTKCHQGEGGSKKCHVLFEWPLNSTTTGCGVVHKLAHTTPVRMDLGSIFTKTQMAFLENLSSPSFQTTYLKKVSFICYIVMSS